MSGWDNNASSWGGGGDTAAAPAWDSNTNTAGAWDSGNANTGDAWNTENANPDSAAPSGGETFGVEGMTIDENTGNDGGGYSGGDRACFNCGEPG